MNNGPDLTTANTDGQRLRKYETRKQNEQFGPELVICQEPNKSTSSFPNHASSNSHDTLTNVVFLGSARRV